jgi:shikimate kinase
MVTSGGGSIYIGRKLNLRLGKDYKIVYLLKVIKMIIERTSKEVVFRLPSTTKLEDLQEIANLFAFKEISRKSKATQKDVDELVKKIKKGRWAKTKRKIGL